MCKTTRRPHLRADPTVAHARNRVCSHAHSHARACAHRHAYILDPGILTSGIGVVMCVLHPRARATSDA